MQVTIKDSEIASKVMDMLEERIKTQLNKGYSKYNQTLDECSDEAYDWNGMLIEELIDGIQYLVKQNGVLRRKWLQEKTRRMSLEKMVKGDS
jgi:predicted transcriptional regulator